MFAIFALVGMLIGAFLNLCADQLPIRRHVCQPPCCPLCDHTRPVWTLMGTVAFLRAKRRCRFCGDPLSLRHLLVEIGTAILYAILWLNDGPSTQLVEDSVFSAILILVIVIDLEHMLIPNVVIYPAWGIALVSSLLDPRQGSLRFTLTGALAGGAVLGLIYLAGLLFVQLMGRARGSKISTKAFGLGDVRLGVFLGLIIGYPQVLPTIVLAILLGGLTASIYLFVEHIVRHRYTQYSAIPYGPFLATSGLLFMLLQSQVVGVLPIG